MGKTIKNYQNHDGGLKKIKKIKNTSPRKKFDLSTYVDPEFDDEYADDDDEYPINKK